MKPYSIEIDLHVRVISIKKCKKGINEIKKYYKA